MRGPDFASSEDSLSITDRAAIRISDPAYSGMATNIQEYLIESIVDPLVYIAPGDWLVEDLMGGGGKFGDFDQAFTAQNVSDLIAWMYTIE